MTNSYMWVVSIAVIPNRGAGLEMVPGVPPTFGFAKVLGQTWGDLQISVPHSLNHIRVPPNFLSLKGCREPKEVEKHGCDPKWTEASSRNLESLLSRWIKFFYRIAPSEWEMYLSFGLTIADKVEVIIRPLKLISRW